MCFALEGGVWLHRHTLRGEPMVHLVSADKERLLALGPALGLEPAWLQYKPLKDPRTGVRGAAWHWDGWGAGRKELDGPASESLFSLSSVGARTPGHQFHLPAK